MTRGGRVQARGRLLRRAGLIAGVLVALTLLFAFSGPWVLTIVTGAVAAVAVVRDGVVADARVVVGACSPVPVRIKALEAALRDVAAADAAGVVAAAHLDGLTPIDDVRGPAGYRQDAALALVRRAVATVTT